MKKIAYSLLMTFLFGSFFPSYQAYANGRKFLIALEDQKNIRSKENSDLIDALSKNANFKEYFLLVNVYCYNLSLRVEDGILKDKKTLKILENFDNSAIVEKEKVSKLLGFEDYTQNSQYSYKLSELGKNLLSTFPILKQLDKTEVESILSAAATKGDFAANFKKYVITDADYDACNLKARNDLNACKSAKQPFHWYKWAALATALVCVAAFVACSIIVVIAASATAPEVVAAEAAVNGAMIAKIFMGITGLCWPMAFSAFGGTFNESVTSICDDNANMDLKFCDLIKHTDRTITGGRE